MDQDLKKKWVEALRSGDYQQGKSRLRSDESYCCLGVLCDVLDPDGWHYSDSLGEDGWSYGWSYGPDSLVGYLPNDAIRMDDQVVLSGMNDFGSDFNQIADWIETTL